MAEKKAKLHKRQWENKEESDEEEVEDDQEEQLDSNEDENSDEFEDLDEEGDDAEDDGDDDEEEDSDEDDELDCDSEDLIDIALPQKNKKQKQGDSDDEDEDDDEEDEEDDDDEDDESEASDLNVEMEFKDANESMFHSVKGLVSSYLDSDGFVSSTFADAIVKQAQLGTFIVIDEEEEENAKKIREKAKLEREINTIGFCTLLGAENPALTEVLRFAKEKSEKHASPKDHEKLLSVFSNPQKLGLLINERIINVAPQAVPVLHQQILEDFKWVKENHPSDFKSKFDFDFLLCIAKCVKEPSSSTPAFQKDPQLGHKKFKKNQEDEAKSMKVTEDLTDYLYPKFEDFLLLEKAVAKFIFEAPRNKQSIDVVKTKQVTFKAVFIIRMCDYLKTVPQFALQLTQ